jgi:hypothetical protein
MQALELFLSSIRSPHTKKAYDGYFKKYLEFVGINEDIFCGNNPRSIEQKIPGADLSSVNGDATYLLAVK